MNYVDPFRDEGLARTLAGAIARDAGSARIYRFMEFCGGHTHAIFRHGLQDLLPGNIEMIHGPGCPVCVLPVGRLDMAIRMAQQPGVILASFGDLLRVPGSNGTSLMKAKAEGADIRVIYSVADALGLARACPDREVVFFAIGFETTTPPTALALLAAAEEGLSNFSVFCNHVLTPPAIGHLLAEEGDTRIDGILGPSHVSVVIGSRPYDPLAQSFGMPIVISGFEPLDVLQSIHMLTRQCNEGRAEVENQYRRAVTASGNPRALAAMEEVFSIRPSFEWRGLGEVPYSARGIRPAYSAYDAESRFSIPYTPAQGAKSCECPAVLRGAKKPIDCKLFATVCTPDTPLGACMVSEEGACAAYYAYGGSRVAAE